MTYEEKLVIADEYLNKEAEVTWEDLPDINSLHDCETVEEIHGACQERLEEAGFVLQEDEDQYLEDDSDFADADV